MICIVSNYFSCTTVYPSLCAVLQNCDLLVKKKMLLAEMGAGSDSKMSGRSDAGQMRALRKTVGVIDVNVDDLHLLKFIISH